MADHSELRRIEMEICDAKHHLKRILLNNPETVVNLIGAPGIGKSQVLEQICRELENETGEPWQLRDIRVPHFDPIELKGIPIYDEKTGKTRWVTPNFWPTEEDGNVIIFLDEFSNAPPAIQNVCLSLLCEKRLHDYVVPKKVRIVLAGNLAEHGCYVQKLSTAAANRAIHFFCKTSFPTVAKYWKTLPDFRPEILNFLEIQPELVHDMKAALQSDTGLAWPSPRSWETLSKIMNGSFPSGEKLSVELLEPLSIATVGQGAAINFSTFLQHWVKVNPKNVMEKGVMPDIEVTDVSSLYAATGAVAHYFIKILKPGKLTDEHGKNFLKFLDFLPQEYKIRTVKLCDFPGDGGKHLTFLRRSQPESIKTLGSAIRLLLDTDE